MITGKRKTRAEAGADDTDIHIFLHMAEVLTPDNIPNIGQRTN
jgi:hypothetical protein